MRRRFGFARSERLARAADFRATLASPCQARDSLFTLRARENGRPDRGRLGLAVSRSVARAAVRRNRLKRCIRESFRQHKSLLAGLDVVVLANPRAAAADGAAWRGSLERLWQKIAAKCKHS